MNLQEQIERLLKERFQPQQLSVVDESARHAGHAGALAGGHYRVRMVSAAFSGKPPLDRHRQVNEVLKEFFNRGIHALALDLRAPEEVS